MNKNTLNNVKKNHIKGLLIEILVVLLILITIFSQIDSLFNSSKPEMFLSLILTAVGTFFLILYVPKILKTISLISNPENADVFKMYDGVDKIDKLINDSKDNALYQDLRLFISDKCIYDKKNLNKFVTPNDILLVYKYIRRYGYRDTYYSIIIVTKYGKKMSFKYPRKHGQLVDNLIMLIHEISPYSKLGYNKENLDYVKYNKIKLEDKI